MKQRTTLTLCMAFLVIVTIGHPWQPSKKCRGKHCPPTPTVTATAAVQEGIATFPVITGTVIYDCQALNCITPIK